MAKIFANNVGSTRITATYKDGNVTVTDFVDISVIKTAGNLTAAIYNHRTFNGSAQDIATMESYTGNYYFGLGSGTGTNNAPTTWGPANTKLQATNAGTYYVWAKCDESTSYESVAAKYIGTVTISKRNVTVTAPTKTTSALSYNGYAQTLASGGVTKVTNNTSTTVGTMYYYVSTSSTAPTTFSTSTWKTTATAINAGSYYIWYYADVDTANNDGTGLKTITSLTGSTPVVISKRKVTATAPTVTDRTYSGSAQTIFNAGQSTDGGVMYYSDTYTAFSTSSSSWKQEMPYTQKTNAGDYTIYWYCYVADTSNNQQKSGGGTINAINSVKATISKKSTFAPVLTAGGGSSAVYTGSPYYAKAANASGNPAGIIYYGTAPGSKTYSITASTTATKLDQMSRTDVGTTEIHAYFAPTDSANYTDSDDATTTVTVGVKANGYIKASTTTDRTFDGSAQDIANIESNSGNYYFGIGSSTTSSPTTWGSKNTPLQATTARTYYVWAKCDESTNYKAVSAKYIGTVTIYKRDVTATAPTVTNTTYSGSPQTIFTAGSSTSGGVMYYSETSTAFSTSSSSWNTTMPYTQKTNAGDYTIYWYCYVADTNNNQQSGGGTINQINSVTATIKKKNTSAPVLTAGGGSYAVYTGSPYYAKAANANGNPAGIIYYGTEPGSKSYSIKASTTSANLDKMSRTDFGTTTIHAYFEPTDRANYTDSPDAITTVTVGLKANGYITASTTTDRTFNGSAQDIANILTHSGSYHFGLGSSDKSAPKTWEAANTKLQATNAGTYYVWAYSEETPNYKKSAETYIGTVTIAKRNVTATAPTAFDRTFNGTATTPAGSPQTIFTAGSSTPGGVMYYSATNTAFSTSSSSWKQEMPYTQKTNAGTYTIYWYCYVDDTNNNQQSGGETINKINSVIAIISKKVTSAPVLTAGGGSSVVYDSTKSYTATAANASDNPAGIIYYGTEPKSNSFSITASTTATKLDKMSRKDVGTTTIYAYFVPTDNANYNYSAAATTTVTVGIKADLSIAKTNYSGTYDGNKHVSSIKITNSDWTGKTIVKGTTSSYGTTVTESGVANTAYELYSSINAVPTTTTIYYKVTGDNNYKDATGSVTFLMNKKDGYLTATTTNRTYTGSAQDIATIESNTGNYYFGFGKGTSSTDGPSSWTNNVNTKLQATNAGTYYVWAKCDESTNYKAVSAKYIGTVTIAKRDVTATAPTVSNKTFNGTISTPNGSPQTIFGAGSSTPGGVMYYSATNTEFSTSSSSWKQEMPYTQKTNAGTYTIYWYCYVDDTNNNQQSGGETINKINSVTATISKANAVLPTTWSGDSKVYHNGPAVLTISGYYGGTVYYRYDKNGGTNWSTSSTTQPTRPDSDGVGSTSVQCMIKGDSNHNDTSWSSAVTLTITAAKDVRHTFTLASDLTYTGSEQKLIIGTDVHGGTIQVGLGTSGTVAPTNWSSIDTSITGTNAGPYYIWYKFTHDAEHDSSTDVSATYVGSVTIGKKTGYLDASTTNRTFNGTATNNAGSAQDIATIKNSSGDYYFGISSSTSVGPTTWGSKNTKLQATNAGTYYVWAKCDESTNYKAVAAKWIGTVTISRAAGDISFTANTTSFSFYCTTNAETATTTLANNDLTISTAGATSGTGTVSVTANNGWSVLNNGKTLRVPIGTAGETGAGKTYTITVTATAAETSNFNAASKSATITVVVKSQVLERIEFKVKNAETATLKYGETSTAVSVIAYYSSGDTAKKDVTSDAEYTYSISNIAIVTK